MIRDIIRFGDDRLLAENLPVEPGWPEMPALLADMIETCHAAPGIGLAAPQIGVNRRLAIIDLTVGQDPDALIVLVNPVILDTSGGQKEAEGCLSVPDLTERVLRPAKVRVRARDASRLQREIDGSDRLAR